MAHDSFLEQVHAVNFAGARDEGLAHLEDIVDLYHPKLDLQREELRSYLLETITFNLDAEMRRGLELYYRLAHKHGFISSVCPLRTTVR